MTTNRKLIRSTGLIGIATSSSRVLGFVRDVLFAKLFGTNIYAQAFVVAFRIPNMLRDMVGEGATNAAIVPVLTEYRHKSSEREYWDAARVILNLMLLVLVVLSVIGVLFAPVLVRLIAPGFLKDPEKFASAVFLTRMIVPYLIFLGIWAYSKGVLNSFQYFTTPAFAPVVLNVTMIAAILFLCPVIGIHGMVAGVLAGGFLQVLIQIPPLYKRGFRLKGGFRLVHPVASRIGKLLMPRILGTAVYQLSVFIDTILASLAWIVGAGGVAALYYSHRLIHLPLAIFGISLATAVLPRMSREAAANDIDKLKGTIAFSLNTVFMVMVPAAAGLMILSEPVVRILFQRGEFTGYSTAITSSALFFYAFGLCAYAGIKILVNAYYSMGDTRTPVRTAAISLVVNIVLNLILMWPLKIGGLALATSIAATTNFLILYVLLMRRVGDIGTRAIISMFGRICAATCVMILVTHIAKNVLFSDGVSDLIGFAAIVATIVVSGVVYLVAAHIFGVEGVRKTIEMLKGKRK